MRMILIEEGNFNSMFQTTLDKLKLVSMEEGVIDIKLNSQMEVTNFIQNLHRSFHYEVCMLKDRLVKG
jgi:hypothetical protein